MSVALAETMTPNPREHIGANLPPATTAEKMMAAYEELFSGVPPLEAKFERLPAKVGNDTDLGLVGDVSKAASKLAKQIDEDRKEETKPFRTHVEEVNACFNGFKERLDKIIKALEQRATEYQTFKVAEERRRLAIEAQRLEDEAQRQRALATKADEDGQTGKALKHDDRAEAASDAAWRVGQAAQASQADLTRTRSATGVLATSKGGWTFAIEDIAKIPLETLRPYLTTEVIEKALRAHVKTFKDTVAIPGVRIFQEHKASFK